MHTISFGVVGSDAMPYRSRPHNKDISIAINKQHFEDHSATSRKRAGRSCSVSHQQRRTGALNVCDHLFGEQAHDARGIHVEFLGGRGHIADLGEEVLEGAALENLYVGGGFEGGHDGV